MEFTCHTKYDQKAMTAMARAVRKTVRAKRSRMVRVWAWIIIALLAVSLWISWGNVWQTAADWLQLCSRRISHGQWGTNGKMHGG